MTFTLIHGHGIFRSDNISQIVPVVNEDFLVEVVPPNVSTSEFIFRFVKVTEISLQINLLVNKKEEELIDSQYMKILREQYDVSEAEFTGLLYGSKPSKSASKAMLNYKRRLKKVEEYQQKVAIVQADPTSPDYQSNLAALAAEGPSPETFAKQQESLDKIRDRAQAKLLEIIESQDDSNEEAVEHPVIAMFETDEHREDILNRTNSLLNRFHAVNFGGGYYEDEEGGEDPEVVDEADYVSGSEARLEQDLENAFAAANDPNTLRNNVDEDEGENDSEDGSEEGSPVEDSPEEA